MQHSFQARKDEVELRPLVGEECEKYRILRNNEAIRKWFFSDRIISKSDQQEWYSLYLERDNEYMFSIYYRDRFVGGIGLYDIQSNNETGEVGRIVINEAFQGKGIGTNSIIMICDIASKMGLNMISAHIYANNIASKQAFFKAGFYEEETILDKDVCYFHKILHK